MSVLDKAKAHFQQKVDGGLKAIEVPEWETTIYFGAETLEQRDTYFADIAANRFEGHAKILIARARDENGKPIFSQNDLITLKKRVDPDVVTRVAMEIFGAGEEEELDVGKS